MKFLKSTITLFVIALALQETHVEAKMLLFNPIQFVKEFCEVVVLVEGLEHEHKKKHGHPLVKSVFGSIWNNLITFINEPSISTFSAVYIDFSSYLLMPLEGGWQAPEAHTKFNEDPRSYNNAGITEDYLFKQSTEIFKEKYW